MVRFLMLSITACCLSLVGCGDPEPTQTPEEMQAGHAHYQQDMKEQMQQQRRGRR